MFLASRNRETWREETNCMTKTKGAGSLTDLREPQRPRTSASGTFYNNWLCISPPVKQGVAAVGTLHLPL